MPDSRPSRRGPTAPAPRGQGAGAGAAGGAGGRAAADPNAPRIVASGVSGDGRQSNVELGKIAFDMKVDYAVKQIQDYLASIR